MRDSCPVSVVGIVAIVLGASTTASAQTDPNTVRDALVGALARLNDLTLTVDFESMPDNSNRLITGYSRITLVGPPPWRYWRVECSTREAGIPRPSNYIRSYDGVHNCYLSDDGQGASFPPSPPVELMDFAPFYLSHVGIGTASGDTATAWESAFTGASVSLADDPERPGIVLLRKDYFLRELDKRYGFMPTRLRVSPEKSDGIEFVYTGYQCYDGLWLPEHLERHGGKGPAREHLRTEEVRINQGLRPTDVTICFPFGTSVLYENDVTRFYGTASIAEAEEGLHNWLAYPTWVERVPPDTKPRATRTALVIREPDAPLVVIGGLFVGLLLLAIAIRRRRAALAAVAGCLLVLAPGANAADGEPKVIGQGPSAAHSVFVVLSIYSHPADLAGLLREVADTAEPARLSAISAQLSQAGVYTAAVPADLDTLAAWPHPVILRLSLPPGMPNDEGAFVDCKYVVCVGARDGDYTLIDANPFGHLTPWPRETLENRCLGDMLLTSPVPIDVHRPWRTAIWCTAGFVLVTIVLLVAPRRGARGAAVAVLVLIVAFLSGCKRDGQAAADPESARCPLVLEPAEWHVGRTYPTFVSREFVLRNDGNTPITVSGTASCGSSAWGLPENLRLAPSEQHALRLSINFGPYRGQTTRELIFRCSDGTSRMVLVDADVRRGLSADPPELTLTGDQPGELASADVRLVCDDGEPFELLDARADEGAEVTLDRAARTVRLSMRHANREPSVTTLLVIETSHPFARTVNVPVIARFRLSWELEPTGLYFHAADAAEQVERSVRVTSRAGTPFIVLADKNTLADVLPQTAVPAAAQEVRVRVHWPARVTGTRHELLTLRTTLPDAPEIPLPLVFYQ